MLQLRESEQQLYIGLSPGIIAQHGKRILRREAHRTSEEVYCHGRESHASARHHLLAACGSTMIKDQFDCQLCIGLDARGKEKRQSR